MVEKNSPFLYFAVLHSFFLGEKYAKFSVTCYNTPMNPGKIIRIVGLVAAMSAGLLLLVAASATPADAVTTPSFPSCLSPQGTKKVEYLDGVHGVPGQFAENRGSDRVYTLSDATLLQCLCREDGSGIQTNWWKVSSLTEDQINELRRLGWVYVPDGQFWGLDASSYMALNSDYSCNGQGGQILATSTTNILGLAATGDKLPIWYLSAIGVTALIGGRALRRFTEER